MGESRQPAHDSSLEQVVQEHLVPLLDLLAASDVEEMRLEHEGVRLHVVRTPQSYTVLPDAQPGEGPSPEPEPTTQTVRSGLVGVFFRARSGDDPPVVEEGALVSEGQLVGYVEVLNLFNEVHTPYAGVLERILVDSGEPVEYGQPLALVRPPEPAGAADVE